MRRAVPLLLAMLVVVAAIFAERTSTPAMGESTVVVELFTSQGCSSCPPADELLRRIAHDPKLRGKVIPLAYHVDYWNSLGWRDPFSSRQWSERQGDYVRAMKLSSPYTPQIVINGAREMVGSNSGQVYRAIEEESQRAAMGSVRIERNGGKAIIRASSHRRDLDLLVVAFERGATTRITSGENRGKSLVNGAIVRTLTRFDELGEKRIDVPEPFGVAAFLQERGSRRIVASSVTRAASPL